MKYLYTDKELESGILLTDRIGEMQRPAFPFVEAYIIFWNLDQSREIYIDGIKKCINADEVVCVTPHQTIEIPKEAEGGFRAFLFNRAFYCIHENDNEVSCEGLLFYGSSATSRLSLTGEEKQSFETLFSVFKEELENKDSIQGEMLRMLLKRLIIKCTRLAKKQTLPDDPLNSHLEIIRKFNLLVEQNFREKRQVKDYAEMLFKSPKTLSHIFEQSYHLTPLQVIQQRVELEARRLLLQTEKTVQEIGFMLGFTEPATFSRFFKNKTGVSPHHFRYNPADSAQEEEVSSVGDKV